MLYTESIYNNFLENKTLNEKILFYIFSYFCTSTTSC